MKKRILSLALALCLFWTMLPVTAHAAEVVASGSCGKNATWTLDDEGTLTISGTGTMEYGQNTQWHDYKGEIKAVIIKEGITNVADNAFGDYCWELVSVQLPESVTKIGQKAFSGAYALSEINLPSGLTEIGEEAFFGCQSLTSIVIPDGVKVLKEGVFDRSGLQEIVLPAELEQVEFGAFNRNLALTSITFPQNIKILGDSAFYYCIHLKEIYFTGDAPESIAQNCFSSVQATVYYPTNNSTWTSDMMLNYDGELEWISMCPGGCRYEASNVEATCLEPSGVRYTCSTCGKTYLEPDGVTSALGHEYVDGVCVRCGDLENKPAVPVVTAVRVPATGEIRLDWEAVEEASKYHIYRARETDRNHAYVQTVTDNTYTDTTAEIGVGYYYYVIAENEEGGQSAPSASAYQTRGVAQPVLTVGNDPATGKIQISWNAVEGAQSYKLYFSEDGETYHSIGRTLNSYETSLIHDKGNVGDTLTYKLLAQGPYVSGFSVDSEYSEPKAGTRALPRPVVSLSNDPATGKIQISWEPVEGAVQYKVYRSRSGKTGTWSRISTTTKTSVINAKNIQPGDKFYYTVIAIAENTAANSASAVGKARMCDLPQPVITVKYVASSNGINISWEPIEGAVQYKVYRSLTGNAGTWSRISTTTKTSVTNIKNVDRNKKYYYKVIAIADNSSANSAYSEAKVYMSKLDAPVLTATNIASSGKIKLSWTKVEGAVKYEVYRATSQNGAYSLLITTKNTSINNTSTTAGKTYYYKIKAISEDPAANSDYSAVKARTCDLPRPTTTAGVNTKGQPKLTWKAVDGAVSYKVYRATTENGSYKLMKTTANTTYVNTSITTYETYFYKVVAVAENTAANSAQSVAKAITSTSVNITPSKLNKDFLSRINEYREYFEIDTLDWNKDAELTVRTRAAEYQIAYESNRPDGRAVDKMLESVGIQFELGLEADADAADVVDIIMYYEEYEDYAALFMYEDWEHAVIARNGDYWCIMFG